MNKTVDLVQRHIELLDKMQAMFATAAAENNREFTGFELLRFEALNGEAKAVLGQIAAADQFAAKVAQSRQSDVVGCELLPSPTLAPAKTATALAANNRYMPSDVALVAAPHHVRPVSGLTRLTQSLQARLGYDMDRSGARPTSSTVGATIHGYASLFNVLSHVIKGGRQFAVQPGAFVLGRQPVQFCRHHDLSRPYASTETGTLRLWQDNHGLAFEARVDASSRSGHDMLTAIASGAQCGVSACFERDRTSRTGVIAGRNVEVISRTRISEISACTEPLCPGTVCWVAGTKPADMPAAARPLAQMFRVPK
jgi:HK97 family phage prohead protease